MTSLLSNREFAETLSYWATTGGIIIGLGGALIAYWTYRSNLKVQEWERARASYGAFIDTAISNPEFIPGYWTNSAQQDPMKMYKYLWFMAKFLWAAEEILKSMLSEKDAWRSAIGLVIREHADFFTSPVGQFESRHYAEPLTKLLRETLEAFELSKDKQDVEFFTHAQSKRRSRAS